MNLKISAKQSLMIIRYIKINTQMINFNSIVIFLRKLKKQQNNIEP